MSYLVTARRWRPQTFEELVGQDHVSRTLMNALRTGKVAHAFLFTGVRGVGKTTAARILAKALNCEHGPGPTPCNTCSICREITTGSAVDILEIDGASNTGVDDVREIIDNVRYSPARCRFKIYIIDEVHMLSNSAFNALLKTLEEPPAHVKFIFATTDPHKLPATVQSRCQRYDFRRIPLHLVAQRLRRIVDEEGFKISDRALRILAREGEGSMRDAQSLLDQVLAAGAAEISDEEVLAALGIADRKFVHEIAEALIRHEGAQALRLLNDLYLAGHDMRRLTRDLVGHLRNLAVARICAAEELFPDLVPEERDVVCGQARRMDAEWCDRAFRVLLETEEEMGRTPYPKLLLEMCFIKLATLPPLVSAEELLGRIEEMEGRLRASSGSVPKPSMREAAGRTPGRPDASERVSTASRAEPKGKKAVAGASDWGAFVDFVARERPALAHHLALCGGRLKEEGLLVIEAPRGFHYNYLVHGEQAEQIAALAARYFGTQVRVSVVPRPEGDATISSPRARGTAAGAGTENGVLQNPVVRAAVEILGGEVHEVRPRTKRREAE